MSTTREKISTASTWACYACEKFAIDPVFIQNTRIRDLIALHRECLTTLITPMKRSLALHSQGPRSRRRPRA